jgi:tRNA threonylcarbamoyladenosine biosynthesis protein TsaB
MNILALDTSAAVLSAALSTEAGSWYLEADGGLRHGELLMDTVDRLLGSAGLKPADLGLVACMRGPGSFTGLRIAFAATKGLALALGIPMVSVPTLDCMAFPHAAWPGLVLPAMDAKKGRFFAALYKDGHLLTDYLDASPEELAEKIQETALYESPVLLAGPGVETLRDSLAPLIPGAGRLYADPAGKRGKARELLEIAKMQGTPGSDAELFSGPLYLRKSDAELSVETK